MFASQTVSLFVLAGTAASTPVNAPIHVYKTNDVSVAAHTLVAAVHYVKVKDGVARAKNGKEQPRARLASNTTVWFVNEQAHNLNAFGVGKVPSADFLRFSQPSMVFGEHKTYPFGINEHKKSGWNKEDMAKEGNFQSAFMNMTIKAYNDQILHTLKHGITLF